MTNCSPRICYTPDMPYTKLYLLVEGDDDERFVERAIIPQLRSRYDHVQAWQYAKKKPQKVDALLRSIEAMGADYFLLGDIDSHACLSMKRTALLDKFAKLDEKRTVIVVKEIESWYVAGLANRNPVGVRWPRDTNSITKEQFDAVMPRIFDSRINFMVELLTHFDVRTASRRNASFRYFARRCSLIPA